MRRAHERRLRQREEEHARLRIETLHDGADAMKLRIAYAPRELHTSFLAHVRARPGWGIRVERGVREVVIADQAYVVERAWKEGDDTSMPARLERLPSDPEQLFRCFVRLRSIHGTQPARAPITVEVCRDTGGPPLVRRSLSVSPIAEAQPQRERPWDRSRWLRRR
jgi:hypothetical protein